MSLSPFYVGGGWQIRHTSNLKQNECYSKSCSHPQTTRPILKTGRYTTLSTIAIAFGRSKLFPGNFCYHFLDFWSKADGLGWTVQAAKSGRSYNQTADCLKGKSLTAHSDETERSSEMKVNGLKDWKWTFNTVLDRPVWCSIHFCSRPFLLNRPNFKTDRLLSRHHSL